MSPSVDRAEEPAFAEKPNLQIHGIGVEYPAFSNGPEVVERIARNNYPKSQAMDKVLYINQYTGIDTRAAIGNSDHPLANMPEPPSIDVLCEIFLDIGVKLSVAACRKAIEQWGGDLRDITHVVSTTCTNSANPGFDHYVVKELGLNVSVEKVLLHGVGCSGGLAALRTAAGLALGSSFRRRPARILVLACEISSVLVRSELDSIHRNQEVRIGVTLFSDCASALVLGNGVGNKHAEEPLLELLGWEHRILENTEKDLGFDVHPHGWKVVLTPQVPKLTAPAVPSIFEDLIGSISPSELDNKSGAADFDWALHPGGSTIITNVEKIMGLTPEHLRASYEVYMAHGNSSSATVFAVLKNLMGQPGKEHVVGCAFGPGIAIEMVVFKRYPGSRSGSESPVQLLQAEPVD